MYNVNYLKQFLLFDILSGFFFFNNQKLKTIVFTKKKNK